MNKRIIKSSSKKSESSLFLILLLSMFLNSCSTLESGWDSITSAGEYVYDSAIGVWQDDEPLESEAVVIEEVYEVPEFANPDPNLDFSNQGFNELPQQQFIPQQSLPPQGYYAAPIYRSARQYYNVSPNGSPLPAPPPPPFPQYSIEPNIGNYGYSPSQRYGYGSLNDYSDSLSNQPYMDNNTQNEIIFPDKIMSAEEEMELFGIENNCIRVINDYMNGGYMCDDFD